MKINTMDYNIFYEDKTNIKHINFGKIQIFNNKKYIPIYYNQNNDKKTKYNDLLIKTPRLFVPNKPRRETGFKPSLEVIMIKGADDGVLVFTDILKKIEKKIQKQIEKRKRLNLKGKEFVPLIRDDNKYKTNKFYVPLGIYTSSCIDINNKQINEWEFITPTYGYFIILVKNVWISDYKWGINIFCNGAMILPSQLMDPPPIPVQELKYMFGPEIDSLKTVGDSELYRQFFKLKKMRVPIQAIKNKMKLEGLDDSVIDLKADTPLSEVKLSSQQPNNIRLLNIPPPPPPPPPLTPFKISSVSLLKNTKNTFSRSSSTSIHTQLITELLTKKNSVLKKKSQNPERQCLIQKEQDNRVPSLNQIKNAINKLKSSSSC
jgi:hypothetical protein